MGWEKGMNSVKIKLMLAMGYLGAVIGAGFASGQEIVQFFVAYGYCGMKGCIVAAGLFALCGAMLLYLAHRWQVSNYQDMLHQMMGERMGALVDFLLAIFLFLGISTMLSASGAVFYEHLYLPKNLGIFLAYSVVVAFLLTGKRGLIISYNLLVPVKIILLLLISGYAAFWVEGQAMEVYTTFVCPSEARFWLLSSLLYVAYNFSLAMVVLSEYQTVGGRGDGIAGAAWGGLVLGALVLVNYIALSRFLPVVMHYEVPMLYVAGKISLPAKHVYTMVLWVGILTTALANAYGFAQRFAGFTGLSYRICLVLCMTLALPVSMRSFSSLVGKIYPLFGILGILIITTLMYRTTKDLAAELYYYIMQYITGRKEA
ncbi:YkvI family membrane protein [Syntrophomonas curvata]